MQPRPGRPKRAAGALCLCLAALSALPAAGARRAGPGRAPALPVCVFSPSDGIQYFQAYGVLDASGFSTDLEATYYYRDASPILSPGASWDEIAAVRGKTLIREADWLRLVRVNGVLLNFRVSATPCTIAGVPYLVVTYARGADPGERG